MYNYGVTFREKPASGEGPEHNTQAFIKTDLPHTPNQLLNILASSGFRMSMEEMQRNFVNIETLSDEQADLCFGSSKMTCRCRTPFGDIFVVPEGCAQVTVLAGEQVRTVTLPANAVNADCTGDMARLVLRDAIAEASGKPAHSVTWSDVARYAGKIRPETGVQVSDDDIMLLLGGKPDEPIAHETYEMVLVITENDAKEIQDNLETAGLQDRNTTITKTVIFPNGMEMDIKCCPATDETSWTEAVLFLPTGGECCFTEPDEEFLGPWELECDGITYRVEVQTGKTEAVFPKGKEPFDADKLHQEAYRLYQLDWMASHGYTVADIVRHAVKYHNDTMDPEDPDAALPDENEIFDNWEDESGFNGSIWVCMDEFLGAEYQDEGYMRHILPDALYGYYMRDIAQ